MPDHTIQLTEAERAQVERVQAQLGLPTPEAAARWLLDARLRRTMRSITGRDRRQPFLVSGRRPTP